MVLSAIIASGVVTAENISSEVGRISSFSGDVWIHTDGKLLNITDGGRYPLKKEEGFPLLFNGDSIITGKHASAIILLRDETTLHVDEQTTIKFNVRKIDGKEEIQYLNSRKGKFKLTLIS